MAASQLPFSIPADVALLHAIVRRDIEAVKCALGAGAKLEWKGIPALHVCALCDWADPMPLLRAAGADVDAHLATHWCYMDEIKARLEALGIPEDRCAAAVQHEPQGKSPLAVAVCCGAVSTASALLAAGAGIEGAYRQLVQLAVRKTEQLGPQAAAAAVPALVQQCAAALVVAPLPNGAALDEAFTAAAELAFPHAVRHPGCPWLLEQLLQLHRTSSVDAPHDSVLAACNALLSRAQHATVDHSALSSAIVAWLSTHGAGSLRYKSLANMFKNVCQHGMVAVLLALLALPRMRELLRAEAERPSDQMLPGTGNLIQLVFCAASLGRLEVLDAVLAAGGAVTLGSVHSAATGFETAALQLLLRRGRPPVPPNGIAICPPTAQARDGGFAACPVFAVLNTFATELDEMRQALRQSYGYMDDENEEAFRNDSQQLHERALAVMDCLADAGYRPSTFTDYTTVVRGHSKVLPTYDPAVDTRLVNRWELHTSGRWLWKAAQSERWSTGRHASFPPAFRQAARMLLLVAHRGACAAGKSSAGAAQLARLPPELLHVVLAHAAYPLSAWRPQMEGGRRQINWHNSDGGSPSSDHSAPSSDSGSPSSNGGAPSSDGSLPSSNPGSHSSDGSLPSSDDGLYSSEAGWSSSNGGLPSSEHSLPSSTDGSPSSDSLPSSDGGLPSSNGGGGSGEASGGDSEEEVSSERTVSV